MKTIQDFFNKNGYAVIRNVLDNEVAGLAYQYCITKVRRASYLIDNYPEYYIKKWEGGFGDLQIPNTYYCYGDPLMETLLANVLPKMEEYVGEELVPTYSFWRFYQKGDKLVKHKDRESCEVSTTLCLGYNTSNVNANTYPNYAWPMYIEDLNGTVIPVSLNPGDMILYKGCELLHWREPYMGLNHAQVFLHYNRKNNNDNNKYDGRQYLGLPQVGGI